MKNLLNLWKPRNLILYGRITILKSLGLSTLIYNASVFKFPVTFIASVKRTICDFVWNQHTPETKEQILEEIIWNNRFIKIEGLYVYYREWHNAGITRVKDIFNKNKFLAPDAFSKKFSLKSSNFLKYLALCSAFPQDWIRILKVIHETPAPVPDTVNTISINELSCKIATQSLIAKMFHPPTADRKIRQANLDDHAIQIIYNIPLRILNSPSFNTKSCTIFCKLTQPYLKIKLKRGVDAIFANKNKN